jgi:hypothetical protein
VLSRLAVPRVRVGSCHLYMCTISKGERTISLGRMHRIVEAYFAGLKGPLAERLHAVRALVLRAHAAAHVAGLVGQDQVDEERAASLSGVDVVAQADAPVAEHPHEHRELLLCHVRDVLRSASTARRARCTTADPSRWPGESRPQSPDAPPPASAPARLLARLLGMQPAKHQTSHACTTDHVQRPDAPSPSSSSPASAPSPPPSAPCTHPAKQ